MDATWYVRGWPLTTSSFFHYWDKNGIFPNYFLEYGILALLHKILFNLQRHRCSPLIKCAWELDRSGLEFYPSPFISHTILVKLLTILWTSISSSVNGRKWVSFSGLVRGTWEQGYKHLIPIWGIEYILQFFLNKFLISILSVSYSSMAAETSFPHGHLMASKCFGHN